MFFASGRLLVSKHTPGRVYGAILTREYNSGYSNYNYVFYTDDFGQSWSMLGSDYAISGADEAKLEELPNGDILIISLKNICCIPKYACIHAVHHQNLNTLERWR